MNSTTPNAAEKMDKETLAALKASVAHWDRMATGKQRKGEWPSTTDCALCGMFLAKNCEGCPVMKKTGHSSCKETPYWAARDIWEVEGFSPRFRAAARKELAFLKSLLPKGKTK